MRRSLVLEPGQRQDWLRRACGEDTSLYGEVSTLLAAEGDQGRRLDRFLATGLEELGGAREDRGLPRVEGYRVRRLLGVGGTSTVFLASDSEGRQVALKILRSDLLLRGVERRFRAESIALSKLGHRGFARFLDAGETASGLPYVATEYIPGLPLDDFCEGLELRQVLKLFAELCRAVGHAHRHLVIHRDLKPANILVTPEGEPKILDLGLAGILEGGKEGAFDPTATGRRMLTPAFASPEQLRGDRLTTATDIYSLGVLLYLVLTGRHPHEEARSSPGALARSILEETPSPPSRCRGGLHRDLDAIVLRALRKEPDRRFPSVERLTADLEAFLDGRPVASRRGTAFYRAGRLLWRHRWAAAGAAAFVVLLTMFSALSFLQERRSRLAQEQAQRTLDVLLDLLGATNPKATEGGSTTVAELLERAVQDLPGSLGGEPLLEASVLDALGSVYLGRGELEEAEPLLESALELRRGREGPGLARSLAHLGQLRELEGDFAEAEKLYREAILVGRRAKAPEELALALHGLGDTLHGQALYDAAEGAYRQALNLRLKLHGPHHPKVADTLNHLAVLAHERGEDEAAEGLYRQSLELRRQALGDDHVEVAQSLGNLGALLWEMGRAEEAEALLEEALGIRRNRFGEGHPEVALTLEHLAMAAMSERRYPRAEELLSQAEAIYRRGGGEAGTDVATNLLRQGQLLLLRGSLKEAEPLLRESLEIYRRSLGADHPWGTFPGVSLGQVLIAAGRAHEAEPVLREAVRIRVRSHGEDSWILAEAQGTLGACLAEQGRHREARRLLEPSTARLWEVLGEDHQLTRYARRFLDALEEAPAGAGDPP